MQVFRKTQQVKKLTMSISSLTGARVSVGAFFRRPFRYRTRTVRFPTRPPTRIRCFSTTANPTDLHKSVLTQNDVGFSMAKRLISGEAERRNMVFSPLSINAVLSLITAGAGGPAKEQLLSFLGAESSSSLGSFYCDFAAAALADGSGSGGPSFSFVNGLWVDGSLTLKPCFEQVVKNVYNAEIKQVDFRNKAEEARGEVNSWAEKKTRGVIKDVLPRFSVNELTEVVCANALYFKGTWFEEFDESRTRNHDFYLLDGSSVQAPFITNLKNQAVRAYDGFKVLRLPYRQGRDARKFSMYLILPDAKDGLPALAHQVCSQSGFLEGHIPEKSVPVGDFRIPKFKICFEFEASNVLKSLGLVLPLDYGLTEMVEWSNLVVSGIHHKASIEVDEIGTEAAAVTALKMVGSCCHEYPLVSFVADHPFMYVIREDSTGAVLFIGQVLNPAQSD